MSPLESNNRLNKGRAQMKLIRNTAGYTSLDHRSSEDVLELDKKQSIINYQNINKND